MLNSVSMVGRLAIDPVLKTTPNNIYVVSFTIAVDRDFSRQGEERQTDFFDIIAWRNTAEFISKFFKKGSWIAIQGSLQTHFYDDKNGSKRKSYDIVASNVSFCGSKNEKSSKNEYESQKSPSGEAVPTDDELPF